MNSSEQPFQDDSRAAGEDDVRHQASALLLEHVDVTAADTADVFSYSSAETLDADYCRRLGHLLVQLLAFAVRDGRMDSRGGFIADLHRVVLERTVSTEQLFTFAYLTERAALDELALSDTLGATSEPWPAVAQLVRRASFDVLAAYTERAQLEPSGTAIIDKLTTLYTRPLFDAVLAKEVERAGRFGDEVSLILFDVDQLSTINEEHGYGVGDRILERLGILIRTYFRQNDWVARHSEDCIAVLLSRTGSDMASELADRVRTTVEARLGFTDHRTEEAVSVTLTAAVINIAVGVGETIDPERLMADAEAAVERAKRLGRNRIERVDGYSGAVSS